MKLHFSFREPLDCQTVHAYSLDVLYNTGVVVHSEDARKLYQKHGAKIDDKTVYIPEKMIESSLASAPNSFEMRTGKHRIVIGGDHLCTMPGYGATYVHRNHDKKLGNANDFICLTKLNQSNDLLNLSCPYVLEPFDIPIDCRDMYKIAVTLRYSDKPTFSIIRSRKSVEDSIQCIQELFDNHTDYMIIGNVNLSSPLIMSESTGDVILAHGRAKQPLMIACGSGLSGMTAPPVAASNFLLSNSQVLAGIVLAQIAHPGLPVIYGMPLFGVDPVAATVSIGDPTTALFTMAASEMGHFYHLPIRAGGNFTDSQQLDYQSGLESFMNLFSTLFSDVSLLMHTLGMEDGMNTISYNKYILDEILFHTVRSYLEGFKINDVTLMLDEIKQHGCTGNYINMRNLKLIRKQYHPFPHMDNNDLYENIDTIINDRLSDYKQPDYTHAQLQILKKYVPEISVHGGDI